MAAKEFKMQDLAGLDLDDDGMILDGFDDLDDFDPLQCHQSVPIVDKKLELIPDQPMLKFSLS